MAGRVFVSSVECRYGCGKIFYGRSEVSMKYARTAASNKRTQHGPECPNKGKGVRTK